MEALSASSSGFEYPRPWKLHLDHPLYPRGTRREHHDAIGQVERLLHVMGHQQDGVPLDGEDPLQLGPHPQPRQRVQRTEAARPGRESPASPMSARASSARCCMPPESWFGKRMLEALEPHQRDVVGDQAPPRLGGLAVQPNTMIALEVEPGKERRLLEDEYALAARLSHRLIVDANLARLRALEAREDAQEGGLAAARGADHRDEFPVGHREAEIVEHRHRAAAVWKVLETDRTSILGLIAPAHLVEPLAARA